MVATMKKIGIIMAVIGVVLAQANQSFAGYFNPNPIDKCNVSITSNLQKGSENEDVIRLQNLLSRAGYLSASPNGYFGYQTENAVRAFQRDNGLSSSGVVGEATRNALNERMCDSDIASSMYSYSDYTYGYSSLVTRVEAEDPFVRVINAPSAPTPIALPSLNITTSGAPYPVADIIGDPYFNSNVVTPASVGGSASTHVIYNPQMGYTYGITPQSGSLTVTSPLANAAYNEGDTVNVSWYTNNIGQGTYSVLLENGASSQNRVVGVTAGNSFSFALTKDLLDAVCAGSCNNSNQNSYRVIIKTDVRDIAGLVTPLKAMVQPVTINRQFLYNGQVSVTASKSPVNSGEAFKLYVNIPRGASWDAALAGNYSIRIKATCPAGVTAVVAGSPCGTEFVIPFAPVYFQQEIPTVITNTSWYKQNVMYDLTVVNLAGQVIGTSQVNVVANGAPLGW